MSLITGRGIGTTCLEFLAWCLAATSIPPLISSSNEQQEVRDKNFVSV